MVVPPKNVYVNDVLIGQASTWAEVNALLRAKKIVFVGRPGSAEGPTAFFIFGASLAAEAKQPESGTGTA